MNGWIYIQTKTLSIGVRVSAILYISTVFDEDEDKSCFISLSNGVTLHCESTADEIELQISRNI